MIKTTIKKTIKEYDDSGNVIKETITETVEEDTNIYGQNQPINIPYNYPNNPYEPYFNFCNTTTQDNSDTTRN